MKVVDFLLTLTLLLPVGSQGFAQQTPYRSGQANQSSLTVAEKKMRYAKEVLRQEFDFQLTPVSEGKFNLDITTSTKGPVFIKVYDIIGNLLYEQTVRVRNTRQLEVDLSHLPVNMFVIEVGNEDTNRTKSIVAL